MPENAFGLVELAFTFGLTAVFGVWQLWSIEKTRKRLRQQEQERRRPD
jgi:hypothetical protein